MIQQKDGGPAFPVSRDPEFPKTSQAGEPKPGMTLRDYFAAQALPSVYAATFNGFANSGMPGEQYAAKVATGAYALADAMIAARGAA